MSATPKYKPRVCCDCPPDLKQRAVAVAHAQGYSKLAPWLRTVLEQAVKRGETRIRLGQSS